MFNSAVPAPSNHFMSMVWVILEEIIVPILNAHTLLILLDFELAKSLWFVLFFKKSLENWLSLHQFLFCFQPETLECFVTWVSFLPSPWQAQFCGLFQFKVEVEAKRATYPQGRPVGALAPKHPCSALQCVQDGAWRSSKGGSVLIKWRARTERASSHLTSG